MYNTMRRKDQLDPNTGHSIFSLMPGGRSDTVLSAGGESLDLPVDRHPRSSDVTAPVPGSAVGHIRPVDPVGELEHRFPNVIGLLTRVWGQPTASAVFHTLFLDKQGAVRSWPRVVWGDLLLLWGVHCERLAAEGRPVTVADRADPRRFSLLELGYGHVLERLRVCWGDPQSFGVVFEDLIIDRRGDRAGWPADIWAELLFLQDLHYEAWRDVPQVETDDEPKPDDDDAAAELSWPK